ncbi:endonuclease/exonuclease/phosphatase family protein [Micromonospora endolithica]|uniref:Endonuclease/exonuclease/phosphatase family protein n=1 Tax=Micromonospora endolithica TaxID=230091 RepID=A0A3A9ZM85_9ACTN|nr:endonuclease/exonuclease/phosphatase family protein [Micromonospora endolithica]RKN49393.1 endonuclease/exonuclease/phosphatase family protein [Micromonospora endolithica]TWJ23585.1 endonuclease/exonuclease/phosphatase (EEP) superfamily protein YafD [Micromonospora endolithica]
MIETERGGGTRRHRATSALCWLAVAPAVAWAGVRLLGLDRGPLVQALAFTPYAALASLTPLVLAVALRRRWPAVVAAVTATVLVALVAPRALADRQPAVAGPTVRLLTANLLAGAADARAVVDLVRRHRVDVLTVQEFTPDAQVQLDRLGLAELLPHRQLHPRVGTVGSGLYARFPVGDGGVRHNRGGWGFDQAYGTLAVPDAPPVRVESAHPSAPYAIDQVGHWRADLAAQPPATPDGPLRILAGDFNATLDHAPLRALLGTGYVDAADAVGAGLVGTWGPYDGDPIPPVTIDHVLVDRRIAVRAVSVHPVRGSDHRAVLAEVTLPRVPPGPGPGRR